MFTLVLPDNSTVPLPDRDGEIFTNFEYRICQTNGVTDLLKGGCGADDRTAEHYSEQWGAGLAFLQFIKANPQALNHMPSGQLGWSDLISRIRKRAEVEQVLVYDAACGYGGVFCSLFANPIPRFLRYIGADVHRALPDIERPRDVPLSAARFVRWDISNPLPVAEKFDFVICRNALMHTPVPQQTLGSLTAALTDEGTLAVSVYATKPLLREKLDDALRELIVPLPPADAFAIAHQFTLLGKDLRSSPGRIVISRDLPFFNIKAGEYDIQSFIYDHILKCWYNDVFGEKYSDVVNFDWYHPPFAYRFTLDGFIVMLRNAGLDVNKTLSISAQHYAEAVKKI